MGEENKVSHLYDSILTGEMLFQRSITPMMIVDATRTIIKANRRFCEMFGYLLEDIVGKQTVILTPSEEHFKQYAKAFEQTLDGSLESSELLYKKSDGTLFWVKLTGVPLETEVGDFVLWSFDDITQEVNTKISLERSNKELEQSNKELEVIFERTKSGLVYVIDGIIQKVNNSFLSIIDENKKENILGTKIHRFVKCFDDSKDKKNTKIKRFELKNGNTILTEREIINIAENCYLVVFSDITVHVKEKESLTRMAEIDGLTKIYNRRTFTNISQNMLTNNQHKVFSLVMLDIDFFKRVNDSWGHGVGDDVLIELSSLIKNMLRKGEIIGRMGGEEFGIMLSLSRSEAAIVCERIRHAVLEHRFTDKKLKLTISMGMVDSAAFDDVDFEVMYKAADKNLYIAKHRGRNKLVFEDIS